MIKVSIIVPIFNSEKYLKRCLDSLISQTMQEIEIICIDDGSTDKSLLILHEYEIIDNRIRTYRFETNKGVAPARNVGIKMACGKYIQFVDADDYIENDMLEKLYEKAELTQCDMCFLRLQLHLENKEADGQKPIGINGVYNKVYIGKELLLLFTKNEEFFLYECLVFYNRNYLNRNNVSFKEIPVGEGGSMILRCLYRANKVIVINEKPYHYCVNRESVTNKSNRRLTTLLGQIDQYIDMLKILSNEENSMVLEEFLKRQYKKINGGIRDLSIEGEAYILSKLEDGFSQMVFRMLICQNQYISEFCGEEIYRMRSAEQIVIYGAGNASHDVIQLMNKYRIKILGFAVSNPEINPESLYGHKVYDIKELRLKKNLLIVIAANQRYHIQIKDDLEKLGFQDMIFLNITI